MKTLSTLAALCLCAGLWGCASTSDNTAMSASPGAVSEDCCGSCETPCGADKDAAYGAMGEKDCSSKSDCSTPCGSSAQPASMGAVNDAPCSGKSKSDCSSPCGSSAQPASLGAVNDAPCSGKSKSDCSGEVCPMSGKPVAANMGAMSDSPSCASKSSCSSTKKSCGNK